MTRLITEHWPTIFFTFGLFFDAQLYWSEKTLKIIQATVHAMAVKYGGKFVDSFLKGLHIHDTQLCYLRHDSLLSCSKIENSLQFLTFYRPTSKRTMRL